jgi:predicted RNA-binding Zn ribbon-like protein
MADATTQRPTKLIGGEPCLDFVNTVSGRGPSGRLVEGHDYADRILVERLDSWDDVIEWAARAQAVDRTVAERLLQGSQASAAATAEMLTRARALREALYRVFKAVVEGWTPPAADVDRLNREIAALRASEVLVWEGGRPELRWRGEDERAYPLWQVVRSAERLLTSSRLDCVGQCPGDDCGWLFLDTSRGGRRRWCDMADCGNVAKVRRHRRRARLRDR